MDGRSLWTQGLHKLVVDALQLMLTRLGTRWRRYRKGRKGDLVELGRWDTSIPLAVALGVPG